MEAWKGKQKIDSDPDSDPDDRWKHGGLWASATNALDGGASLRARSVPGGADAVTAALRP